MRAPAFAFRPGAWPTLLMLGLVGVFVSLGQWQLGKAELKQAAQAELDAAARALPVALPAVLVADPAALHHKRVEVRGRYDAAGQILIDNRVLHERPGFHVITPLVIDGAHDGLRVLVNRGWIPAPPTRGAVIAPVEPAVPDGPVHVAGTAVLPPTHFFALATDTAPPGGNAVWQNLDLARYRSATRQALQPLVIRLAPEAPDGFDRAWPRLDERHQKHQSYAWQWFGFAATSVAIWLFFAIRRVPVDTGPHAADRVEDPPTDNGPRHAAADPVPRQPVPTP